MKDGKRYGCNGRRHEILQWGFNSWIDHDALTEEDLKDLRYSPSPGAN